MAVNLGTLTSLPTDWKQNYRHHGGARALFRCLQGTLTMLAKEDVAHVGTPMFDCVTFSVVPGLTALWHYFIERAIISAGLRVIIGDCSGGFRPVTASAKLEVFPLLNFHHGKKLDLFVTKLCSAEYIIVSDDDVLWLDSAPWEWAREQFSQDPSIAVVSLVPRTHVSRVLREHKIEQPMGSYCLILRTSIWHDEALSFEKVFPRGWLGRDWIYDTADYAHREIVRRGYKVVVAPASIRDHLVQFDSISTWTLKLQSDEGRIAERLANLPRRQEKALQTVYTLRGISFILREKFSFQEPQLVPETWLQRAEEICTSSMTEQQVDEIRGSVDMKLGQLSTALGLQVS